MKTLTTYDLNTVSGGVSKNSEVSTALSSLSKDIQGLAAQKNNSGFDPMMGMVLALVMSKNNQSSPTVIAAPGAAPAASGPIVNISTRVRRGW
jgi:hypothetical protein